MGGDFVIDVDVPQDLVKISMTGFFFEKDIDRFVIARNRAHRLLKCRANMHLTLVDIRGMKIQSQVSVEAFRSVLNNPAYISRKLAIIVSQSLAVLQIKRAAAGRDARFFEDVDLATAWLLAGDHSIA